MSLKENQVRFFEELYGTSLLKNAPIDKKRIITPNSLTINFDFLSPNCLFSLLKLPRRPNILLKGEGKRIKITPITAKKVPAISPILELAVDSLKNLL